MFKRVKYLTTGILFATLSAVVVAKGDFRVNDDTGTATQRDPAMAMNKLGNFVIVWTDSRYGKPNVFGQRYYNDSLPWSGEVRINDEDTCSHICGRQSVVVNDTVCGFVWMDDRNGN